MIRLAQQLRFLSPSCFYFDLFFNSKYLLSEHYSKKRVFSFSGSRTVQKDNSDNSEAVVNMFSEAATRLLKNIEMFLEAAIQSST